MDYSRSVLKKNAFPIIVIAFILVIIAAIATLAHLESVFETPAIPTAFVEFDTTKLQKNDYLSKEVSDNLQFAENFGLIESFRAYSEDSILGRTYIFEFTLKNGQKTLSAVAGRFDYESYPKVFMAQKAGHKYFNFVVTTDGEEYNAMPSNAYFYSVAALIKKAFADAESRPVKDLIWQRRSDEVKKMVESGDRGDSDSYWMFTPYGSMQMKEKMDVVNGVNRPGKSN